MFTIADIINHVRVKNPQVEWLTYRFSIELSMCDKLDIVEKDGVIYVVIVCGKLTVRISSFVKKTTKNHKQMVAVIEQLNQMLNVYKAVSV